MDRRAWQVTVHGGHKERYDWSDLSCTHECLLEQLYCYIAYSLFIFLMAFSIHWYESTMDLHVFPFPIPPPASLSIPSLWVFPVHQPWTLVSCIQPGLVICFTLDSILVSMPFSQNIPPSPSPTEFQSVLYICVSFSVLHIGLSLQTINLKNIHHWLFKNVLFYTGV